MIKFRGGVPHQSTFVATLRMSPGRPDEGLRPFDPPNGGARAAERFDYAGGRRLVEPGRGGCCAEPFSSVRLTAAGVPCLDNQIAIIWRIR